MTHLAVFALLLAGATPGPNRYFCITVVDEATGRGVPLVELETTQGARYYTDSAGVVAFYEPGLMNERVFFHVKSHGYEFPKDGFGYAGKALDVKEGGEARLTVRRTNIAERLYRITGGGIYRDSVLLGRSPAGGQIRQPVLNALVFGSDSVVNARFRDKIYWFWGDTNRPAYPLGNFNVPGATSDLPGKGGLDPAVGVNLAYFVDANGFAKETCRMPGPGPTWINGLAVLRDVTGAERMFACYVKIKPPMETYERGLVEFDAERNEFKKLKTISLEAPLYPRGHPMMYRSGGIDYVYFADPFPLTRVKATPEALQDVGQYEAFTPLAAGSRIAKPNVLRKDGGLDYAWRNDAPLVGPGEFQKLVGKKLAAAEDALVQLRDVQTNKPVLAHGGSTYFNPYRKRWVAIIVEAFGSSMLGEIWFAEADTPLGPWVWAQKVVTHVKYSFYNPKQHPFFDQEGGRIIYFEGTYTHTFSGNPEKTPYYDYNQVMYRLDLADRRLALPVAVYALADGRLGTCHDPQWGSEPRRIAFFLPDRPRDGCVPLYADDASQRLVLGTDKQAPAADSHLVGYGAPDSEKTPAATVPLYEFTDGKRYLYSTNANWSRLGFQRTERPVCRVWPNPLKYAFPADGSR